MAGSVARKINAAVLVLNHISPRYDKDPEISLTKVVADAKRSAGSSLVAIAYDFMEILVPWLGFRSLPEENKDEPATMETKTEKE